MSTDPDKPRARKSVPNPKLDSALSELNIKLRQRLDGVYRNFKSELNEFDAGMVSKGLWQIERDFGVDLKSLVISAGIDIAALVSELGSTRPAANRFLWVKTQLTAFITYIHAKDSIYATYGLEASAAEALERATAHLNATLQLGRKLEGARRQRRKPPADPVKTEISRLKADGVFHSRKICARLDALIERSSEAKRAKFSPRKSWVAKTNKRRWIENYDDRRTRNAVKTYINKVK